MSQRTYFQREEFVFGQHEMAQQPIAIIERRGWTSGGLAPSTRAGVTTKRRRAC
jgi:hypothetical protein